MQRPDVQDPVSQGSPGQLVWVLCGLVQLAACDNGRTESSAKAQGKQGAGEAPRVSVVSPEPGEGADVVMGSIVPNRQIFITPEASGRIQTLHVKLGDYVAAGAPLVTLDPRNAALGVYQASAAVGVAKAGLQVATTGLTSATTEYRRYKKLYEEKTIPEATFDKVKTAYLMAQAQVNLAQQQLQATQAAAAMAYKGRQDVVTRAPFAGYVTRILMNEGDMVRSMPPSNVLMLADVTPVVVEVAVGELMLSRLPKPAQTVKLVIPGLGNRELRPTMGEVMPELNALTRSATLRIELPNPDRSLKLGLSVEIHLEGAGAQVLTLPASAVKTQGKEHTVLRVSGDGILERVAVSVGQRRGPRVVLRGGVGPKDRIVADFDQPGLSVGRRVQAVPVE